MHRNAWYLINTRRRAGSAVLRLPSRTPEWLVRELATWLGGLPCWSGLDYARPGQSL